MAGNARPQLDTALDGHLQKQFQSLVTDKDSAINDAIEEVDNLIENLKKSYKNKPPEHDESLEHLRGTLVNFRDFAEAYYCTILGLVGSRDHARLSQALAKIQQEVFVLRRLIEQRWSINLRYALRLADRWSTVYLEYVTTNTKSKPSITRNAKVARDRSNISLTPSDPELRNQFLTFAEDNHRIHMGVLAYNRNPTISLPLIHIKEPGHWMGLAHEIGHFIFNNYDLDQVQDSLRPLHQTIRQSIFAALAKKYIGGESGQDAYPTEQSCMGIAQSIPLWCSWAEELFADVLGAVTLGPAYIDSLIYWMAPRLSDAESLVANDDDHPIVCLRPVFQALVLLKLLGNHDGAAEVTAEVWEILERWYEFCDERFTRSGWLTPSDESGDETAPDVADRIHRRIKSWQSDLRGSTGGVPFSVLFDQVSHIVEAVSGALQQWAPVYDDEIHKTKQEQREKLQQKIVSFQEMEQLEKVCFLAASWYPLGNNQELPFSSDFRSLVAVEPLQRITTEHRRRRRSKAPTRDEALEILCPLLKRSARWATRNGEECNEDAVDLIRDYYCEDVKPQCYGASGDRRKIAEELADWLLGIELAVTEDLSKKSCGSGYALTCVLVAA